MGWYLGFIYMIWWWKPTLRNWAHYIWYIYYMQVAGTFYRNFIHQLDVWVSSKNKSLKKQFIKTLLFTLSTSISTRINIVYQSQYLSEMIQKWFVQQTSKFCTVKQGPRGFLAKSILTLVAPRGVANSTANNLTGSRYWISWRGSYSLSIRQVKNSIPFIEDNPICVDLQIYF